MRALPARITAILLLVVLGLCIYRARIQSFTADEAHVYGMFVSKDLAEMAKVYDACNHVLHTLLMKLSRTWFGTGELALRIPSLIGAALLLRALYLLTLRYFSGWWQPLVALAVVSYPMLLDHMVAARGYGLALALLLWSLLYAADWGTRGYRDRDLLRAGICAGLAIAANLVYLMPAAALGLVLLLIAWKMRRPWIVIERFGVPALVLAFLFLVLPLLKVRPDSFYWGSLSWNEAAGSLVEGVLKANRAFTFGWLAGNQDRIAAVGIVLFWLLSGAFLWRLGRYWKASHPHFVTVLSLLVSGTLLFAVGCQWFLHIAFGTRLPFGRTGLHLVTLLTLSLAAIARTASLRTIRSAGAATLLLTCVVFVSQMEARFFQEWRYDASTLDLLRRLDADRQARGLREAKVAASRYLGPTITYYRERRRMAFLPKSPQIDNLDKSDANYFLLVEQDTTLIPKLGLIKLHESGTTRTVLARRPG